MSMLLFDNLFSINVQCLPLNRITLCKHKSNDNKRMIQLTDTFFVLLRYNGNSKSNKRLILLSVIQFAFKL